MPLMEWNNRLELEVADMNRQHKDLLDLMNTLFDLNQSGASKEQLKDQIEKLAQATVKHFSDEEAYMESIQFPKLEVHKNIHKDLLQKFGEQRQKFNDGDDLLSEEFFNFLKLWLSAHIMGIDKQYSDHSVANKAA